MTSNVGASKITDPKLALGFDNKDKNKYPGLDWLYSSKRKAGDSYQYSTTVVYVLSPASIQDRKTVNVRHILVAPETNDKNTKAKDATDAQWAAAYKKATNCLLYTSRCV